MTYCMPTLNMMEKIGLKICEKHLPRPFYMDYETDSSGSKVKIMYNSFIVWQGSIRLSDAWKDFNDIPAYQPGFEFTHVVLEKYFDTLKILEQEIDNKAKKLVDHTNDLWEKSVIQLKKELGIK